MNNFTPRAQKVLALARKESDKLDLKEVDEELILLALLRLDEGVGIESLRTSNVNYDSLFSIISRETEKKKKRKPKAKHVSYTPQVKKLLAMSGKAAKSRNDTYVGTEHFLLGMLKIRGTSHSIRYMEKLGVNLNTFETQLHKEIDAAYGVAEDYIKTESEPKHEPASGDFELEFSMWIDPGSANTTEIQELFEALSNLNRSLGGGGLTFARDESQQALSVAFAL